MFKRIALVTSALMLAAGAAGAASAATANKPAPVAHPRSQASLQCSAQADAKGLHGKARVAFRHDCLRKAKYHKASHSRAPSRPAANDHKPDKRT
ncbi:MAG: phosphate starvation-inducible protein PsiF [Rhizobiales bacterium]|nr:phosphate starvation-inducible protein PsiF [Hyphomicrobiales bacterium]